MTVALVKQLMFDTLAYANKMNDNGLNGTVLAEGLSSALSHNLYTKAEVKNMISDSDMKMALLQKESEMRAERWQKELEKKHEDQLRSIREQTDRLTEEIRNIPNKSIAILSAVVVGVGALVALLNHL